VSYTITLTVTQKGTLYSCQHFDSTHEQWEPIVVPVFYSCCICSYSQQTTPSSVLIWYDCVKHTIQWAVVFLLG